MTRVLLPGGLDQNRQPVRVDAGAQLRPHLAEQIGRFAAWNLRSKALPHALQRRRRIRLLLGG